MVKMVDAMSSRFKKLMSEVDKTAVENRASRQTLEVSLLMEHPEVVTVTQDTDESYNLSLRESNDGRVSSITSLPYCGEYQQNSKTLLGLSEPVCLN